MTLTPEQREEIEKRASVPGSEVKVSDWDHWQQAISDRRALLADNKELREALAIKDDLYSMCVESRSKVEAALSAAKPQVLTQDDEETIRAVRAKYQFDVDVMSVIEMVDNLSRALTPTQPSPDRLTEEEADRIEAIRSAPEEGEEFLLEIMDRLRLTTPQAPSVPTREKIAETLHESNCGALLPWKELAEGSVLRASRLRDADTILALFTPSPSPDQRGET